MLAAPSAIGAVAQASAASACARRPPPSSRALRATKATLVSPITIVVSRSASSDVPNTTTTARPTTAISGGKSTYPNARWCDASRK